MRSTRRTARTCLDGCHVFVAGEGRVSFVRRLTAEQIDQVVALLRSKNEEYLALGGTGRIGAGYGHRDGVSTRWQWTMSCVDLPRRCRSGARPICMSISVPSISTTRGTIARKAVMMIGPLAGRSSTLLPGRHYSASKAGLLGLTRQLARDHGPRHTDCSDGFHR